MKRAAAAALLLFCAACGSVPLTPGRLLPAQDMKAWREAPLDERVLYAQAMTVKLDPDSQGFTADGAHHPLDDLFPYVRSFGSVEPGSPILRRARLGAGAVFTGLGLSALVASLAMNAVQGPEPNSAGGPSMRAGPFFALLGGMAGLAIGVPLTAFDWPRSAAQVAAHFNRDLLRALKLKGGAWPAPPRP